MQLIFYREYRDIANWLFIIIRDSKEIDKNFYLLRNLISDID